MVIEAQLARFCGVRAVRVDGAGHVAGRTKRRERYVW